MNKLPLLFLLAASLAGSAFAETPTCWMDGGSGGRYSIQTYPMATLQDLRRELYEDQRNKRVLIQAFCYLWLLIFLVQQEDLFDDQN